MSLAFRKSKMISFRLSPDEFQRIKELCATHGLRSISDLARVALLKLIASENGANPLAYEVLDLRRQVRSISVALDRLSEVVNSGDPKNPETLDHADH